MIAAFSAASAQELRPYRPAFDVLDYTLTIDLPDTGATIRGNATLSVREPPAARYAGAGPSRSYRPTSHG